MSLFSKLNDYSVSMINNVFVYHNGKYKYIRGTRDNFPHTHLLIDDNTYYVDKHNSNLYKINEKELLKIISSLKKDCHGFSIEYIYRNICGYTFRNNNKNGFCGNGCKSTIELDKLIEEIE